MKWTFKYLFSDLSFDFFNHYHSIITGNDSATHFDDNAFSIMQLGPIQKGSLPGSVWKVLFRFISIGNSAGSLAGFTSKQAIVKHRRGLCRCFTCKHPVLKKKKRINVTSQWHQWTSINQLDLVSMIYGWFKKKILNLNLQTEYKLKPLLWKEKNPLGPPNRIWTLFFAHKKLHQWLPVNNLYCNEKRG